MFSSFFEEDKRMKKPLIGIVPLIDRQRESYWMLPGYMLGIEEAGGLPVMLPLTRDERELGQLTDTVDGFLFAGGQDVSPRFYNAPRSPFCGESCEERDEMEKILLSLATERDKPILGICRGIQFLNAATGGDLYQDLPSERPTGVTHCQARPMTAPSTPSACSRIPPSGGCSGRKRLS